MLGPVAALMARAVGGAWRRGDVAPAVDPMSSKTGGSRTNRRQQPSSQIVSGPVLPQSSIAPPDTHSPRPHSRPVSPSLRYPPPPLPCQPGQWLVLEMHDTGKALHRREVRASPSVHPLWTRPDCRVPVPPHDPSNPDAPSLSSPPPGRRDCALRAPWPCPPGGRVAASPARLPRHGGGTQGRHEGAHPWTEPYPCQPSLTFAPAPGSPPPTPHPPH